MNGFFITQGKGWERVAYRCDCCKVHLIFAPEDKQPRAFCCGQWVTPPKETFFTTKLPREQFKQPRILEVSRNVFEEVGQ